MSSPSVIRRPGAAGVASLLLLAACSGAAPDRSTTGATAGAPAAPPPVARPMTPSDAACPRDGRWKPCALEDRIGRAGMVARVQDTITVPFFAPKGTRYRIGREARMVVFYFADSAAGATAVATAVATAAAGLDPRRLTPPGDSVGAWPAAPREVIRSANLIAVLFDVNPAQAERVRLAITAGAPVTYPGLTLPGPDTQTVRTLPPMPAR